MYTLQTRNEKQQGPTRSPTHASLPLMHLPRDFSRAERPVSRKMEALMPSSKNAACEKGKMCNSLHCTLSRLASACHASCEDRLGHASQSSAANSYAPPLLAGKQVQPNLNTFNPSLKMP